MKSTHAWVLLSLLFPLSGCKLLEQKPQEEDPTEPVVADAFAVEFDSDGVEQPAARVRARNGVAFKFRGTLSTLTSDAGRARAGARRLSLARCAIRV